MKSLSVAEIREADRRCIEELGIPGVVLMNNAGKAVFDELEWWLHGEGRSYWSSQPVVGLICGKGNNGGDGFVVARHALVAGYKVELVLVATPEEIRGDAGVFMEVYRNLGGNTVSVTEEAEVRKTVHHLAHCTLLVDALLGTGMEGEVREPFRSAIETWPRIHTVAVDVPSGLDADTGEPCGCCVHADTTVTFQFNKLGFENPAAAAYLGRLVVADIGIPEVCADDEAWTRLRGRRRRRKESS